jgi:hypothetical protein
MLSALGEHAIENWFSTRHASPELEAWHPVRMTTLMRRHHHRCALCAWMLAIAQGMVSPTMAEQPAATETDAQRARVAEALQLSLRGAQTYELSHSGSKSATLTFRTEPVLRWSNPERGEIYGNVFVWTHRGRPEVAGSLFKWYSPFQHSSHEFVSLSLAELVARREQAEVWTSAKPGVELRPLTGAPAPAETLAARLVQMRQLARQFAARSTDRDGLPLELRLLTQPIYRYERLAGETATAADWLDGGLFAFVQGTDPELFLMLEARQRQGAWAWHYAFARMNSIAFRVTYQDREIWSLDVLPWRDVTSHREPYTSFRFE